MIDHDQEEPNHLNLRARDLKCHYTKEHGDFIMVCNMNDKVIMIVHKQDWEDIVKWAKMCEEIQ